MFSLLADVMLIATGHRPAAKRQNRGHDIEWNEKFLPRHLQELNVQPRGIFPRRDLSL